MPLRGDRLCRPFPLPMCVCDTRVLFPFAVAGKNERTWGIRLLATLKIVGTEGYGEGCQDFFHCLHGLIVGTEG